MFFAHTKPEAALDEWQELEEHLQNVGRLAADFAHAFGAEQWGMLVGLVHDIGKARPAFQKKLVENLSTREDHKGVGARLCKELGTPFGQMLAYCVAGHHKGLPDASGQGNGKSLKSLCDNADLLPDGVANPLEGVDQPGLPFQPNSVFQCAFFTRMLFSALVDADFLDTESFMNPDKAVWRSSGVSLDALSSALDHHFSTFSSDGNINTLRAEILAHSRAKAALEPGLFTMTVPTGGGKTLSSMAFALDHALKYGLERIIYVIPYTSIIEQNAQVFRDIFPKGSVVEHHSTFDEKRLDLHDPADESAEVRRHRLACENWDAPVVVTTGVQFFESLYSNKPSKCRKLHNLAKAVIVLDEAQMLPTDFFEPCLRALEELATHYGSSVVLCTATQPALDLADLDCGLEGLREIAPDPERLHEAFRRTRLEPVGKRSLPDVADMIRERDRVLCVVNTRKRASELFGMVSEEVGARHLSALMCPVHRSAVLDDIRAALRAGEACRVVSTQLVEAGVDVSFPEVIREMAGLDSIVQAAGRCNREGEIDGLAPVSLFIPQEGVVRPFAMAAGSTESVLRSHGNDPFSPRAIREYFRETLWLKGDGLDRKNILKKFSDPGGEWLFAEVARRFRIIENDMTPIVIPFDEEARRLIRDLGYAEHQGGILRKLQQYTVQVYASQFQALDDAGAVELVNGVYPVLHQMNWYDDRYGLTFPEAAPETVDFVF